MSFSTLIFVAAFLPLFLLCSLLAPGTKAKNVVLLLFSLLFYSFAGLGSLLLLLALGAVSFGLGKQIGAARLAGDDRRARCGISCGVVLLLLVLMLFKYTGFFCTQLRLPAPSLILPLGISFYVFRLISYLADIYMGRLAPQGLFSVLLYTVNFQIISQGPILRFLEMADSIRAREITLDGFLLGLSRFLLGLAKKCLLADHLGELCESFLPLGFLNSGELSVAGAWLGSLCYMLELYLDFAAYSDMAIGLGQICGFHYPENFNYPYMASSIRDFWRRWHISLSAFFRDYVYIPLGGSRVGFGRLTLNLLVVWSLTGFWHGASWNFLLWGLYYFCFLFFENLLRRYGEGITKRWTQAGEKSLPLRVLQGVLQHAYTLLVVYFGWVLFRFSDFTALAGAFRLLFGQGNVVGTSAQVSLTLKNNLWFLLVSLLAVTPLRRMISDAVRNEASRRIQLLLRTRKRAGLEAAAAEGGTEAETMPASVSAISAEETEGEISKTEGGTHSEVLGRVREQVQRQLKTAWLWEIAYYTGWTLWLLLLLFLSVMAMIGSSYMPFLYNQF